MAVSSSPNDPGLKPWARGDPITAGRLDTWQNRTVTTVRGGPGIRVLQKGGDVTVSLAEQPVVRPVAGAVLVAITGDMTAGGHYTGILVGFTGTNLDPATDSVTDTSGEAVVFVNLAEYGLTTHDLTSGINEAGPYGVGAFVSVSWNDGKRTVAGIALSWYTCNIP